MTTCCLLHQIAMKNLILYWVLPFLLILLLLGGCNQRATLRIGNTPQRIEVTDMLGKKLVFPDDFKDRVVMVRFWSMSCVHCDKQIIQDMETLYQKYKDKGFIAVSVNADEPAEMGKEFRKLGKSITYPILLDPDFRIAKLYGVVGFPTTLLLNREGVVKEKVIGETGIQMFESFLPALLMGKQP